MCTVYITLFTNVGPRVGDPWFKGIQRWCRKRIFVPLILAPNKTTAKYGESDLFKMSFLQSPRAND